LSSHGINLGERLSQLKETFLDECTACGECVEACPLLGRGALRDADVAEIAEGRLELLRGEGFSEQAYLFARACLRCSACHQDCPADLDPKQLNIACRIEATRRGGEIARRYREHTQQLRSFLPDNPTNPFRLLHALQTRPDEVAWYRDLPDDPPRADVVLFLSCIGMARLDHILALMDLLNHAQLRFVAIGGLDFCCGMLDTLAGDLDTASEHLERLAASVAHFGAAELVTDCPSCYGWFRDLTQTGPLPFRFRHTTQLLAENLERLPPRSPGQGRVAVQDACHYGRFPDEHQPTRDLVRAIPGFELVEMPRSREHTVCCGSPASGFQPEVAGELRDERAEEAAASRADLIVAPCSGCVTHLGPATSARGMDAENVVTLLARKMGIAHENRLPELLSSRTPEELLCKASGRLWEQMQPRAEVERFVSGLLENQRR
jgi:Fe-S oxidoreductase